MPPDDEEDALTQHPGYLGYGGAAGEFIVAIHADWPAYPGPPGGLDALYDLGQFPHGTTFTKLDDIDQCVLFVAADYARGDPWSEAAFHVAIWHRDLLELSASGLVSGVVPATEREWELRKRDDLREELRDQFTREGIVFSGDPLESLGSVIRGEWVPSYAELPPEDDDDDEFAGWPTHVIFQPGIGITITELGWRHLEQALQRQPATAPALRRAHALLDLEYHDTAVREAAVALESRLRAATKSDKYGQTLVDEYLRQLGSRRRLSNAESKVLRVRLRTAFKFIRNEFAHELVTIPRDRALALLARLSVLIEDVDQLTPLA